jgi:hypothetical protein
MASHQLIAKKEIVILIKVHDTGYDPKLGINGCKSCETLSGPPISTSKYSRMSFSLAPAEKSRGHLFLNENLSI